MFPHRFIFITVLLISSTIFSSEITIFTKTYTGFTATLEYYPKSSSLILRVKPVRPQTGEITPQEVTTFLSEALSHLAPNTPLQSTFIGRAVAYTWVIDHLVSGASNHKHWSSKSGKTREMKLHQMVQDILMSGTALDPFKKALLKSGYRVNGVSVEKVLISNERTHEQHPEVPINGKYPFDAQISLLINQE